MDIVATAQNWAFGYKKSPASAEPIAVAKRGNFFGKPAKKRAAPIRLPAVRASRFLDAAQLDWAVDSSSVLPRRPEPLTWVAFGTAGESIAPLAHPFGAKRTA